MTFVKCSPLNPVYRPADIEAYAWYLEGRHHFLAGTPEALFRGEVCYEHAIARDPSFVLAHDAQSELYWYMGFYGIMAPREAFSRSLWESLRAIELDETMAEAHALLGMLRKEQDYDWAEVRREFDRALELNPASPVVRFRHALSGLMAHGHTREAAAEIERVLETDPLSLFVRWWLYVMWFLSGDMERVRVSVERMVALDASHTLSLHALGGSLLLRGDAAAAVEPFERAASLSGRPLVARMARSCLPLPVVPTPPARCWPKCRSGPGRPTSRRSRSP